MFNKSEKKRIEDIEKTVSELDTVATRAISDALTRELQKQADEHKRQETKMVMLFINKLLNEFPDARELVSNNLEKEAEWFADAWSLWEEACGRSVKPKYPKLSDIFKV